MALGPLKTKKIASEAPSPHLTASKPSGAKTMCRQKLRNEVPAARNLALSCHPRLISPCFLLPSPADISLLSPASHQDMRENATRCDEALSRSWRPDLFAERHEYVARLRHEGRLDDNDVRPGEQFRRLSEQQASQSCHRVRETVKGDPACAPILTAEAHASRANLGWCGVSQRTKFRSSELQSSSGRRTKPTSFRSQY